MAKGMIMRRGGGAAAPALPEFAYTGQYLLIDDGNKNWRMKFLTSGMLTLSKRTVVDAFLVGGGGATAKGVYGTSGGAGGGYTTTADGIVLEADTEYAVTVGAGGVAGSAPTRGGTSSAFTSNALGGYPGAIGSGNQNGGAGGSGGGAGAVAQGKAGNGGSNGSDGTAGVSTASGGAGQQVTTREFGEADGALYAGGGAGGNQVSTGYYPGSPGAGGGGAALASGGQPGETNTGGGAGGVCKDVRVGADGGSGIVVIRNHRAA